MKTIKVSYGGFETEQQVDECLYKAIYNKAIDDFNVDILNKIQFEEKWLFDCKSDNEDTRIAFSALKTFAKNIAEQLKGGVKNE